MSGNQALGTTKSAYETNAGDASQSLGDFRGTEADYLSNVNSAIASGNPYQSKDYLTQQNLQTSGALNSTADAARQQLQDTVARTGTNSAALPNEIAANQRDAQRQLTQFTAGRNTENEDKWLGQRDRLFQMQRAGANDYADVFGKSLSGSTSALGDYTSAANEDQQSRNSIINGLTQAGGVVGGAALKH